jgi:hypothetical protein
MINQSESWRYRGRAILLLLVLGGVAGDLLGAAGQLARRKRSAAREDYGEVAKPQLLNADTDPTLRYPIASFSGWSIHSTSYGWLDVTRRGIHYRVVQPEGKRDEGFEASLEELDEIKLVYAYLQFRISNKKHTIFYLPEERWGTIHSGPGAMQAAGNNAMGTGSIQQALRNFDRVLAMVKPPPPPAPAPVAAPAPAPPPPPAPPTIVLLEPSVATSGQTLEVSANSLAVRGVATDPTGLPLVTINGNPVNMKPRSAQAVEFWSDPIALQPGENKFEIVASNAARAQADFSFKVRLAAPPPPKTWKPAAANPVPMAKAEILQMLKSMPGGQVNALVRENGISFSPSADDLKEVREAGGGDDLIETLKQAPTPANP